MEWKDIAGVVAKAAPIVGTLLGGPAGAAVGGLVAAAIGTESTPDAVSIALQSNPDAMAKVIEVQTNAKVQLQQLLVQAEQNRLQAEGAQYTAEAADRDSARKLATAQPADHTRQWITLLMIVAAFAIVIAVFSGATKDLIKDPSSSLVVGTLMGYVFNELKQVLAFWFGMTKDGSSQTNAITQFATAPGTVTIDNGKAK